MQSTMQHINCTSTLYCWDKVSRYNWWTIFKPCFMSVNLKSGRYFLSLVLLAVFLNWPSDLLVSNCKEWVINQLGIMFTEQRALNQCRTLLPSPTWWPIPGGNCIPCSWCKSLVGKLTFRITPQFLLSPRGYLNRLGLHPPTHTYS